MSARRRREAGEPRTAKSRSELCSSSPEPSSEEWRSVPVTLALAQRRLGARSSALSSSLERRSPRVGLSGALVEAPGDEHPVVLGEGACT